jgi:hypothetical protein
VGLFGTNLHLSNIKIGPKVQKPMGVSYSVLSTTDQRLTRDHYVYGFLPYWTLDRMEHLQLDKLTDIAYFALRIDPEGTIRKFNEEGFVDPGYGNWRENDDLIELIAKAKAHGVRFALTLISHEDDVTYEFLDCRSCWDTLLAELVEELEYRGITNVNMDFELVEPDAEKDFNYKYSQLVNFLNTRLDQRFGDSFLVTSTLPDSSYRPRITDITSLASASDALFVMAYDFHRPTSDTAGPVAPINGAGIHAEYDITTMLKDYLTLAPPEKLILGVPYYGYNWLVDGKEAEAERIPGDDVLGYSISQTYEYVMDTKLEHDPEVLWDEEAQVPYFTYISTEKGTTRQVYYENKDSLRLKYQLAKDNNLAGIGIWALGYDGGYQDLWDLLREEFISGELVSTPGFEPETPKL